MSLNARIGAAFDESLRSLSRRVLRRQHCSRRHREQLAVVRLAEGGAMSTLALIADPVGVLRAAAAEMGRA